MGGRNPLRVAIAGFGPFPGVAKNPSAEIVRRLVRCRRFQADDLELSSDIFPTEYTAADQRLAVLLQDKPDAIVLFGVAGKRREVCIETIARNAASILAPDSRRFVPRQRALIPGNTARLRLRAPANRLLRAARTTGIRARLSRDAGRYLCNASFYRALHETRAGEKPPLVVFVHVPLPRANRPPRKPRKRLRRIPAKLPRFNQLVRACEAILAAAITSARRR